jgi:hypothetical protein
MGSTKSAIAGFAVLSLSELVAERAERELCSW